MPIPGSILNTVFNPASALAVYPSRATLYPISKSKDTTGFEIHSFSASITPGQVALPCRISPLRLVRPQNQENDQGGGIQRTVSDYQVNFMGYVNVPTATLIQWQVNIDGLQYQIRSCEGDGNYLTSRMLVSLIEPFNA